MTDVLPNWCKTDLSHSPRLKRRKRFFKRQAERPVAMVDIDNVLYPFVEAFREVVSQLRGVPVESLSDALTWTFYKDWGLTTPEFLDCMRQGTLYGDLFNRQAPYVGSVYWLERLQELDVEIHLVTNRVIVGATSQAEYQTKLWLMTYSIPYDRLTVTKDKVANGLGGYRWSIDDNVDNYDDLEEALCNPYLLTQPWNTGHPGRRVSSLAEFVLIIEEELS